MGLTGPFERGANFAEMVYDNNVYISKMLQKTCMTINENGIEAAGTNVGKLPLIACNLILEICGTHYIFLV